MFILSSLKKAVKHLFPSKLRRFMNDLRVDKNCEKDSLLIRGLVIHAAQALIRQRKTESKLAAIVFSMDRAMQLHALLGSYREKAENSPPVTIIYRVSSVGHAAAYDEVFREFSDVIHAVIKQETRDSFRHLLIDSLRNASAEHVFFLVDDNMFIEEVDVGKFASLASTYCVPSLRHGSNLLRSYTLHCQQEKPGLTPFVDAASNPSVSEQLLSWCWATGKLDWAYPLSVDGHILPRAEVIAMAETIEFNSPNTFEGNLQVFKPIFEWRVGLCYKKSKLVNIPYNKVQSDFDNIHGEVHQDYMLEKWNQGYIIDRAAYYGLVNESAHQEMPLMLIKKEAV